MKRLFKILPILAIVVGIGGAWASQADESPCEIRGTQGYGTPPNPMQPLGHSSNAAIVNHGKYNEDFTCDTSADECHWVFEPSNPLANPAGWIKCLGDFEKL